MNEIKKTAVDLLGYGFIPPQYLPKGKNEYYLRNQQNISGIKSRGLTASEIHPITGITSLFLMRFHPTWLRIASFSVWLRSENWNLITSNFIISADPSDYTTAPLSAATLETM
jgi:hypothetical protein